MVKAFDGVQKWQAVIKKEVKLDDGSTRTDTYERTIEATMYKDAWDMALAQERYIGGRLESFEKL